MAIADKPHNYDGKILYFHVISASHDKFLEMHWLTTPGPWSDSAGNYRFLIDRVVPHGQYDVNNNNT